MTETNYNILNKFKALSLFDSLFIYFVIKDAFSDLKNKILNQKGTENKKIWLSLTLSFLSIQQNKQIHFLFHRGCSVYFLYFLIFWKLSRKFVNFLCQKSYKCLKIKLQMLIYYFVFNYCHWQFNFLIS